MNYTINETRTMATETESQTDRTAAEEESEVDYLDQEINILNPTTPFMRDHLRVVWGGFILWAIAVFGPVTASLVAPGFMTETIVLGFQLHFFLTAILAPLGALILSAAYAYQRDRLDEKYGIEHTQAAETTEESAAATNGGERSDGSRSSSELRSGGGENA